MKSGMKIFLSCLQSPKRHAVPAYGFWELYFKEGIQEAGDSWAEDPESDWAEGLLYFHHEEEAARWRQRFWPEFVRRFQKLTDSEKPDLALFYLYPHMVDAQGLAAIRKTGVPTLLFFCDHIREFRRIPEAFRGFDLYWVPEKAALDMYRSVGYTGILHLPMPVWIPPQYRNVAPGTEKYGPTFIGSRDIQRQLLLSRLSALVPELEVRGQGWDNAGSAPSAASAPNPVAAPHPGFWAHNLKFVREQGVQAWLRKITRRFVSLPPVRVHTATAPGSVEDYLAITREAAITLGVNRYPSFQFPLEKPGTYSRLRDLEAPMAGACYLTEWAPGLDELYDLGKEIEVYRTAEEAAEKIRFLMGNPEVRHQLRVQGQKRALACHSIPASLAQIKKLL